MFHLLGVLLILSGSCGFGIYYCDLEEKRIRIIKDWKNSLQILMKEIDLKKQPLFFALQECKKRIDGEVGQLWEKTWGRMQEEEEDFLGIWEQEFNLYLKNSLLTKEGKKEIEDFLGFLGYEEKELQIEMLNTKMKEIEKYQINLEEGKGERKKIALMLCSSAGMVLALLLL